MFEVVGPKKEWLELKMNHGRVSFERLPDKFGEGLVDFCIIPIMRKIRDNVTQPQLLMWDKVGYKRGKIKTPPRVPISGDRYSNHFLAGMHKCSATSRRSFGKVWMDGYDWVRDTMWNGLSGIKPWGFLTEQAKIHPVKDGAVYVRDSENCFVHAYIPKGQEEEYVDGDGTVQLKKTSKFLIPTRAGDTSDKFGAKQKQVVLGPGWEKTVKQI
jgi:hypothetical protein